MSWKNQLIIGGRAKAIRRKNLLSEVLRLTRVSIMALLVSDQSINTKLKLDP